MEKHFIASTKRTLFKTISDFGKDPSLFVNHPGKDFSRKRKLDFETFVKFTLGMSGKSMNKEILDFFNFSCDSPSNSAFNQQRSKVLPEAFEYLFHEYTSKLHTTRLFHDYRLLACDGSNLTIAPNPNDSQTRVKSNQSNSLNNRLHLNAFYDLLNRMYVDALIQNWADKNEYLACTQMIDRSQVKGQVLLLADRGYESYNIFAHANEKGWKYLVRVKDVSSNGIAAGLNLPKHGSFDKHISITLSRRQDKETKLRGCKFLPTCQGFDYIPMSSEKEYTINCRILRFPITENTYEVIVTNLGSNEFSSEEIKELYHMRWGIETSFRELKYAVGLANFHAKKPEYIRQEVFARMIMFNFYETIIKHIIIRQPKNNSIYQVNFTLAIFICREYISNNRKLKPPDIELLLQRNILPIRPGRHDPRKVSVQKPVSFLYRVA